MINHELVDIVYRALLSSGQFGKVVNGPAPKDAPNAPSPDATLTGGMGQAELAAWRSPAELQGQRIYTAGGSIDVPPHGVVMTRATDDHEDLCDCAGCAVNKEMRQRGFRRMQAKKSAAEVTTDSIKSVLQAGAQKGALVDRANTIDKSGQLGNQVGGDVYAWLAKRNEANQRDPVPEVTRYTPRDVYIEKLVAKGYTRLQAERIAAGDEP
jgi:hypothetical protein